MGDLVTAALVGTARAGLPDAARLPPALAGIHAELAGRPPEEALLLLAGIAALHDAVGRLPERVAGIEWRLPAFRPEGDRPPCSVAAARYLERMLNQLDTAYLPELLISLDRAGQRAPDYLLPHLLHHGEKMARIRPMLLPILGERGRWLAAINPAWRYAAVATGDANSLRHAWEADPSGRAALAITVRRRAPDAARRLIETTWRSEPEAARRELLAVLESGLSMGDEPFLERALDDRDAQVRRRAAEMLASIPDSRLVDRIKSAAGSILVLGDGGLMPVFPGEINAAMMRDGVTRQEEIGRATAPRSAAEWSRLLIQTVGVIPLGHWETRFGLGPEALVAAALAGKWPRTLLTAFATAAGRQANGGWIDALLTGDHYSERTGMLIPKLAPEDCRARLAQRLAAADDAAVLVFLRRWVGEWDEASAAAIIDYFGRHAASEKETRLGPMLRFQTRQFARQCPPALAGDAAETLIGRAHGRVWENSLANLVSTLALRRDIKEAVEQ